MSLAVGPARGGQVTISFSDGLTSFELATDVDCSAALAQPGRHYLGASADGGPRIAVLMVDGVLYVTGSWSIVVALDARTGRELWRFDPEVPREKGGNACCDVVNRGVVIWQGRVYVGTIDGKPRLLPSRSCYLTTSIVLSHNFCHHFF